MWICRTCAVEHPDIAAACAICADERQWVPADGQQWVTLEELAGGHSAQLTQLEPGLHGITVRPAVGIGQQAHLVQTSDGNLLWDPPGYVDDDIVEQVRALGAVAGIAASHPHMFGVQVEWARRLGDVPVFVCEPDLRWSRGRTR